MSQMVFCAKWYFEPNGLNDEMARARCLREIEFSAKSTISTISRCPERMPNGADRIKTMGLEKDFGKDIQPAIYKKMERLYVYTSRTVPPQRKLQYQSKGKRGKPSFGSAESEKYTSGNLRLTNSIDYFKNESSHKL